MTTTRTPCQQAVLDLATLKAAQIQQVTTGRLVEVRQADKVVRFDPAGVNSLRDAIRLKQAEVDACNGVRSRGRFILNTPSDC